MDNIYFYLLSGVFLYFLFTRILENFQENMTSVSIVPSGPNISSEDNINNIDSIINYLGFPDPIDPCGFYKIRAYGYRVPLYYGWNVLWSDNTWTEFIRNNIKWNGSNSDKYVNNHGVDLITGSNQDPYWSARYLAVKPGYKISTYAYTTDSTMTFMETVHPGEYSYDDFKYVNGVGKNYNVYIIAVQRLTDTFMLPTSISPLN